MVDLDWLLAEQSIALPLTSHFVADDPNWRADVERIEVGPGFSVYLNNIQFHRDVRVESVADDCGPRLIGHVSISGSVDMILADGTRVTPNRETAVMLGRRATPPAIHAFKGGTVHQSVAYVLDVEQVARLLSDHAPAALRPFIDGTKDDNTVIGTASDAALRHTAQRLFSTRFNGPLRRLAIEGGVMQLLACQVARLPSEGPPRAPGLTPRERARLFEARDRLLADMRHPPTLAALASAVGLSEKRLNAGFRLLFGATVFETLRNERLEHARQALETEALSLKQAAFRVGFNHMSNFVNAFTAHFGAPPRRYLKRRQRSLP